MDLPRVLRPQVEGLDAVMASDVALAGQRGLVRGGVISPRSMC